MNKSSSVSKISFFMAMFINVNIMIGAGIYINPPIMAAQAYDLSYLSWAIGALIFLPVVISMAIMSFYFPGEGSFYNYTRHTMGKTTGFIAGWVYCLGYVGVAAAQLLSFREVLVKDFNMIWVTHYPLIFNVLFLAFIVTLCNFSLRAVGNMAKIFTIVKVIPIFIVLFMALFLFKGSAVVSSETLPKGDFSGICLTLPFAIFGFWGFESCCNISHRIKGSKITAAMAIICGFILTALLYTFFNYELLRVMGAETLSQQGVLPAFIKSCGFEGILFVKLFMLIMSITILFSYSGAIFGEFNTNGYLLQAMSHQGLLFYSGFMGKSNSKKQPSNAIIVMGILAFAFTSFTDEKEVMQNIANLGFSLCYLLTLISLCILILRKKEYLKIPAPLIGMISCVLLFRYSWHWIDSIKDILFPFIVILVGFVMYYTHNCMEKKSC